MKHNRVTEHYNNQGPNTQNRKILGTFIYKLIFVCTVLDRPQEHCST